MNLPTKITVARLALIPLMLIFFGLTFIADIGRYFYIGVLAVYIIAALTDLVDGHLARKNNQVTNLGKFLDPIADKSLVFTALFILACGGSFTGTPWILATSCVCCSIIVIREFMIGALRQMAASKNRVLAADVWGKIKTVVTMIAIGVMLAAKFMPSMLSMLVFILGGLGLFFIATILTVFSGVNYLIKNKDVFKDEPNEE